MHETDDLSPCIYCREMTYDRIITGDYVCDRCYQQLQHGGNMKKLLKEEPTKECIDTQAACHNAGINLTSPKEASNEEAIRRILDLFPTLKERLNYLRNKGYTVTHNERNALILLAIRRVRMDNESVNRDNVRLRKQVDALSQTDLSLNPLWEMQAKKSRNPVL